ncbi:MAG: hypothetical protein IT518_19280 [Burkholderiales bacterium]|nr:hypothetical protein [Burkholderiales bacterium]
MTYQTIQYRQSRRERMLKPLFGAVAGMAAMATLGLAVVGPAALSRAEPAVVAKSNADRPTEVAISPASIHIVVHRVKTAQSDLPIVPTAYKPRG